MYLNNEVLSYGAIFKYLGLIIPEPFLDDDKYEKERRNLFVRGNIIIS